MSNPDTGVGIEAELRISVPGLPREPQRPETC
jgi:hypothetical protein